MGVDVEISIKSETLKKEEIERLNKEIYHRIIRYYGEGYERGDWPTIYGLVRFVIKYVDNRGDVYYYGDCNGGIEGLSPTTLQDLEELDEHWVKVGHRPYLGVDPNHPCPKCREPMWKSGWNGKKDMHSCAMCEYTDWKAEKLEEKE